MARNPKPVPGARNQEPETSARNQEPKPGAKNQEAAQGNSNQDKYLSEGSYPFVDVHLQGFVVDREQVAVRAS